MKKTHKYSVVFYLGMMLAIMGCDREVTDVTIPKADKEMVMFSFLSPEDSFIRVELSYSMPVLGKISGSVTYISDATVSIENDNGRKALLPYDVNEKKYKIRQSQYNIVAGEKYTVTAAANGKTVSGSCTILQDTALFANSVTTFLTREGSGPYYKYQVSFVDRPNQTNYYRLNIGNEFIVSPVKDTSRFIMYDRMISDDEMEGGSFTRTIEDNNYSAIDTAFIKQYKVIAYLLSVDKTYFLYHRKRMNYYGDDPFSEPTPMYSNTSNGFGVVCSYRKTTKELLVR